MTPVSEALPTTSIHIKTPDGDLFVHIAESGGHPSELLLNIGKSGYPLAAWSNALGLITSLALKNGVSLREIADELVNIKTDKVTRSNGVAIHSGPEGLGVAIMKYLSAKHDALMEPNDYRAAKLERDS